MQEKMEKVQEELQDKRVEGSSGGGAVVCVVTGSKKIVSLTIKPEAVDPEDVEMLQDLVVSAVNDAITKAEEMMQKDMSQFTGGMKIPGLF